MPFGEEANQFIQRFGSDVERMLQQVAREWQAQRPQSGQRQRGAPLAEMFSVVVLHDFISQTTLQRALPFIAMEHLEPGAPATIGLAESLPIAVAAQLLVGREDQVTVVYTADDYVYAQANTIIQFDDLLQRSFQSSLQQSRWQTGNVFKTEMRALADNVYRFAYHQLAAHTASTLTWWKCLDHATVHCVPCQTKPGPCKPFQHNNWQKLTSRDDCG